MGKTGLMVSRLGLGGIPIQRVTEDEAIVVGKRCLELGINFIDTANGCTTSEERIGKAIAGSRNAERDCVFVSNRKAQMDAKPAIKT